jgi:hypothetical protein
MTLTRIFSIFSSLLFCAMFVVGCSSSSSPSTNNSNSQSTSVKPKIGSAFTDSVSSKDTSLANQPGYSLTYRLGDTNATVGGKSGVYVFTSYGSDSVCCYYETNGDVAVYIDFSAGGFDAGEEWVTFPFASQATSNITTFSTMVIDTVTISGTVHGSGTATQTIDGNSLFVEKATMNAQASAVAGTIPATVSLTYAPSIGILVYQNTTDTGSVFGQNLSGGSTIFVTSYALK